MTLVNCSKTDCIYNRNHKCVLNEIFIYPTIYGPHCADYCKEDDEDDEDGEDDGQVRVRKERRALTRSEILDNAKVCVNGQREQDYGSPEDNFSLIARLWSCYLDVNVTPVDVAMMMIQLKQARIKRGGGTGDSFVDIAGYAACAGEIMDTTITE